MGSKGYLDLHTHLSSLFVVYNTTVVLRTPLLRVLPNTCTLTPTDAARHQRACHTPPDTRPYIVDAARRRRACRAHHHTPLDTGVPTVDTAGHVKRRTPLDTGVLIADTARHVECRMPLEHTTTRR